MPFTKPQLPLDSQTQALFQQVRPLSDYTLRFINHQYPLLSLIYAMFAGGENTLYCDYTEDFIKQYLYTDPNHPTAAETAKANNIYSAVRRVEAERDRTRNLPPEQQTLIQLNSGEWDQLLIILKQELTQNIGPNGQPIHQPPPPPCPMW